MPKTKLKKQEILRDLNAKFGAAKSVFFANFNALGVKDNESLRSQLRSENSEYLAVKKTLLSLAIKDLKIDGLNPRDFDGQIAAIFGYEDEVIPAKIIDKYLKSDKEKKDKMHFVGGILENKYITGAQVEALAQLPSKQQLYGQLVGVINAPVSGFVNVLAGNLRGLVRVLAAISER